VLIIGKFLISTAIDNWQMTFFDRNNQVLHHDLPLFNGNVGRQTDRRLAFTDFIEKEPFDPQHFSALFTSRVPLRHAAAQGNVWSLPKKKNCEKYSTLIV
jgi:hypothetical protein